MMISFDKSVEKSDRDDPKSISFGITRNHQNVSADAKKPVELVKGTSAARRASRRGARSEILGAPRRDLRQNYQLYPEN